jgi:hypothetical protein
MLGTQNIFDTFYMFMKLSVELMGLFDFLSSEVLKKERY